jgi:hypothetical protein
VSGLKARQSRQRIVEPIRWGYFGGEDEGKRTVAGMGNRIRGKSEQKVTEN